jgi:hypothetical protein
MSEKSKAAFAHDDATAEIVPRSTKDSKMTTPKTITIIVVILGLLVLYLVNSNGSARVSPKRGATLAEAPVVCQPRELEKIITLSTNWSPTVFVHTNEKFEAHMLDLNCWWEVRFNGEKIYTLYPVNNDPHPEVVPFKEIVSSLEWRILPGPIKSAKLNYRIFKNG